MQVDMEANASGACGDITQVLRDFRSGDPDAESRLIAIVYRDLHTMAAQFMRKERKGHTLQASALVNETYLRLIGGSHVDWQDRLHFFRVAAQVMRHVLVDHAKRRLAGKRGAGMPVFQLDDAMGIAPGRIDEVLCVDEALRRLETVDARAGQVVVFRIFGGLNIVEIAKVMDVSSRTVKRDWEFARAWLKAELSSGGSDDAQGN